ncbi:ATP-binding protein [Pseudorhodoferax soli]|uniref:Anti-sigma regulatory factor (Ser/Thr protein kinase) n=1 Tax=Pseudorhodoferax soli TaxID=545864 RepID=A0A368XGV6_9BURK|nr:ATP-binding protein [Pseudorhodoferax soli]RCW65707.1 anti-sigma regulatory factor (Ser/Thr protein kinase) [Pseudorhodoferax soli]
MHADEGVQRQRIHIDREADVYNAAMLVYALVQQAGARTLLATEAATVVSELGMNIVKYAGRGSMTVSLQTSPRAYVEVLAEDRGPGIADLALALTESYSSRGTLGLGLPGVRRMSDQFDIRSEAAAGTRVRARRWLQDAPPSTAERTGPALPDSPAAIRQPGTPAGWQYGQARRPCYGEIVSGDGCVLQAVPHGTVFGILDVLGHGAEAHRLARHCERWLAANAHADVVGLAEGLHAEVRGSIGLALTLVFVDAQSRQAVVTGVGNTRLFCLRVPGLCIDAQPGIVGGNNMPRLRPTRVQITPQDTLLLTTDGINERLTVEQLLPLRHHGVQHVAQQVLREHGKDHDDATCMVLRCPP